MKIKIIVVSGLLILGLLTACDKAPETTVTTEAPVAAPAAETTPSAPATEAVTAPATTN